MALSTALSGALSDEDINLVPEFVRGKICGHIENIRRILESTKKENEEIKVQKGEVESLLVELTNETDTKLKQLNSVVSSQQETSSKLQQQLTEVTEQFRNADQLATRVSSEHQNAVRELERVLTEKTELTEQLERRSRESSRLTADIRDLSEQLAAANRAKCDATLKLQDMDSRESALQFRERRMEQEKEMLQRQLDIATRELENRTEELASKRRENHTASIELQLQLSKTQDELELSRAEEERLQLLVTDLQRRVETQMESLRGQRESEIELEGNYRKQLVSQTRLAQLYKDGAEEAEAKCAETLKSVDELRRLLTQAGEQQVRSEEQLQLLEQQHAAQLAKLESHNKQLQLQIDSCEQQLQFITKRGGITDEDIEQMAPSAAAVSRLLSSGMSLTQIFSEFCAAKDGEIAARAEAEQLQIHLEQMVGEIEQRAPVIQQLRDDYQAALRTIDVLTESHDSAVKACDAARIEAEDARRQFRSLTAANSKLTEQCADLSTQVRVLLKEIEEARGGLVSSSTEQTDLDVSTSQNLISSRLVTFRSIEELQRRNQELLAVARELSARDEQMADDNNENSTQSQQKLQADLSLAQEELAELRASRQREVALVENIVRQRDLYRSLVRQQTPADSAPTEDAASGDGTKRSPVKSPAAAAASQDQLRCDLLQQQLQELREEYDFYKGEQKENVKILNEQLLKQSDLLADHRVRNAKLTSRLEYNDQRFTIVQSNCEQYRRQVAALEDKYKQSSALSAKYEETITALRENALSLQERVSRAEVRAEHVQQELTALRQSEARLVAERESLLRERDTGSLLLNSLQDIKHNLQQAHTNAAMNFQNEVDTLKREVSTLQCRNEQDVFKHRQAVKVWEADVAKLRSQLDEVKSSEQKATSALQEQQAMVQRLNEQLTAAQSAAATRDSDAAVCGSPVVELRQLRQQLQQCRGQLNAATQQLAAAGRRLEQQRSIAEAAEARLAESDTTLQECQRDFNQRMAECDAANKELEKMVETLKSEKQLLEGQLESQLGGQGGDSAAVEELEARLQSTTAELEATRSHLEEMKALHEEAMTASRDENERRIEAEDKYQREVCLHAEDLAALSACRQRETEAANVQARLEEARCAAETRLAESENSWQLQKEQLHVERNRWQQEQEQLQQQNQLLHDQLQQLGTQLSAVQLRLESFQETGAPQQLNVSFNEQDATSSDQLLEIIRYLRRQREIADSRAETAAAEGTRLRSQLDAVRAQLAAAEQRLVRQDEGGEAVADTVARHAELLRKVETLSAVTDSNRLLRREHSQLTKTGAELQAQLDECRAQLEPLQSEKAELQARVDALEDTVATLKAESSRWQQRTNELTEKANKFNPQEFKQLQCEKEAVVREVNETQQRLQRQQAELARLRNARQTDADQLNQLKQTSAEHATSNKQLTGQLTACRQEANQLRTEITQLKQQVLQLQQKNKELSDLADLRERQMEKLREEIAKLTEQVTEKDTALTELRTSNLQVKKIGRKYKTQYEELQVECDKVKDQLKEATESAAAAAAATAAAAAEGPSVEQLQEQLTSSRQELEQQRGTAKQHEEKTRAVLQKFKQKLFQLTAENKAMREKAGSSDDATSELEMRSAALRSQYSNRVSTLERELTEARAAADDKLREEELLRKRLNALEKQLQLKQQGKPVSTPLVSEEGGGLSSGRTPTANIRPMSGGCGSVSVSCGSVSVAAGPSGTPTSARATPTASIRPMKPSVTPARSTAAVPPSQQQPPQQTAELSVATVSPTPAVSQTAVVVSQPAVTAAAEVAPAAAEVVPTAAETWIAAATSNSPASAAEAGPSDAVPSQDQLPSTSRGGFKRPAEDAVSDAVETTKRVRAAETSDPTETPETGENEPVPEAAAAEPTRDMLDAAEDDVIVLDSDEAEETAVAEEEGEMVDEEEEVEDEMVEEEEEEEMGEEYVDDEVGEDGGNTAEYDQDGEGLEEGDVADSAEEEEADEDDGEPVMEVPEVGGDGSEVVEAQPGLQPFASASVAPVAVTDDTGDSIVPSTPTLTVTQLTETVPSPQSGAGDASSATPLDSTAGMDDTRVDLAQISDQPAAATAGQQRRGQLSGRTFRGGRAQQRGNRGTAAGRGGPLLPRPQPIVWADGTQQQQHGGAPTARGFRQLQRARRSRGGRAMPH